MVKDMPNKFSEVTPEIEELAKKCNKKIDEELFAKYDVKRGLRKRNGEGVLAGLTDISMINAYTMIDREIVPCEGKLYYRGIDIEDIVKGFIEEDRFGFEETAYLLLFGELPNKDALKQFEGMLGEYRQLPTNFVRDIIMKAPSCDMMNTLARSVLTLFSYDDNASDISLPNVLRQCIQLIALFPVLSVYAYQAYNHYERGESLFIHLPDPELSTAENILHLLRPDSKYTKLEAKLLDMALVLHAEHGGGNNSTFTTHVVSSSGTDTYSAIAAALCSLKGPKHGGANIKVVQMFDDLKANVKDWSNEEEIREYLLKLLNKEAFDKAGLIYGMGHAVYSLSDPRSKILSRFVKQLSEEKGKEEGKGKGKGEHIPPTPLPGGSPALQDAFAAWIRYKHEKRQDYKPTGLQSLVTQVQKAAETYGEQAVIDLIGECMANNWQGIIFDRLKSGQAPRRGGNVFLDIAREEGIV